MRSGSKPDSGVGKGLVESLTFLVVADLDLAGFEDFAAIDALHVLRVVILRDQRVRLCLQEGAVIGGSAIGRSAIAEPTARRTEIIALRLLKPRVSARIDKHAGLPLSVSL